MALPAQTFPGIHSNNEVQIEGIAYIFCGLWISSVLACLCVTSQLNGPWFDSRCWLCQQPEEATDGNGAKEANNINIANKAAEANDARKPTTPRRPTRGPWPRLACTEDSPLVRSAVLAQAEANDAKRLLMERRPTTPTCTPTSSCSSTTTQLLLPSCRQPGGRQLLPCRASNAPYARRGSSATSP